MGLKHGGIMISRICPLYFKHHIKITGCPNFMKFMSLKRYGCLKGFDVVLYINVKIFHPMQTGT